MPKRRIINKNKDYILNIIEERFDIREIEEQYEMFKRCEKWLLNFKPEDIEIAIILLSKIQYINDKKVYESIDKLCKKIKNLYNTNFNDICISHLGEYAGESGSQFLYKISKNLDIPKNSIISEKNKMMEFKKIILIDDIIGTGNQATTFSNNILNDFKELRVEITYCALYGFEDGIEAIKKNSLFDDVICINTLYNSEKAFHNNSLVFDNEEEKNLVLKLAEEYGNKIYPKHPLGYDGTQALLCFNELINTPNNTLPIIWGSEKNEIEKTAIWEPLFTRKKRVYKKPNKIVQRNKFKIVNLFDKLIKTPIKYTESDLVKPQEYFSQKGALYKNIDCFNIYENSNKTFDKLFDLSFSRVHANPSKKNVLEASKYFFVNSENLLNNIKYLNNDLGLDSFMKDIITQRNKLFFIAGARGSGKTYTLNHFLNINTSELIRKNIFWIRVDVSKVYDNYDDIELYLAMQFLYVGFKYRNNEKIFEDIYSYSSEYQKLTNLTGKEQHKIKEIFNCNTKPKKNIVKKEAHLIKKAYNDILNYFKFKNKRILYIFDGIDNVDYSLSKKEYFNFIQQIKQIVENDEKKDSDAFLITCRYETLKYFRAIGLKHNDSSLYEIEFIKPSKILDDRRSKIEQLKKGKGHHIKNLRRILLNKNKKIIILDDFINFIQKYDSLLLKVFDNKMDKQFSSEELINNLYNGNIRDYFKDMRNSFLYIREYVKKRFPEFYNEKTKIIEEEFFSNILTNIKPYITTEGLFTEGSIYKDSNALIANTQVKSYHLNFFNDAIITGRNSRELNFMFLKFFLKFNKSKTLDELSQYIDNKELLERCIFKLIEYGYIEFDDNYSLKSSNPLMLDTTNHNLLFKKTKKYTFMIDYIWKDLFLFYSYALDTSIPDELLEKKYITVHKNDWSDIEDCMITTSFTFIRLLKEYLGELITNENIDSIISSIKYVSKENSYSRVMEKIKYPDQFKSKK